jgi:hypothetical protein
VTRSIRPATSADDDRGRSGLVTVPSDPAIQRQQNAVIDCIWDLAHMSDEASRVMLVRAPRLGHSGASRSEAADDWLGDATLVAPREGRWLGPSAHS